MGGVEFREGALFVERPANALDELAMEFSELFSEMAIDHVFVAGYVAILTGRARSTEDIDVLLEPLPESEVDALVTELRDAGYWGPAMPLEATYENLTEGTNIWIAPEDQVTPHLEVKFTRDEFDAASLGNAIDAHVGGSTVPIGPLELQIAYKLYLGGEKDLEDAAHLYVLFGETLRQSTLEDWVERLDVTDQYERLTEL
jgi:hypothetical protein